jgi:hypothetical protein
MKVYFVKQGQNGQKCFEIKNLTYSTAPIPSRKDYLRMRQIKIKLLNTHIY